MRVEFDNLRVALVHYWLVTWGGGERVLAALADLFPQADIYTVVATDAIANRFAPHQVHTSFLQSIPGSRRWHRQFLPLYPIALEQFDLRDYDLVISSNSGPAHGVLTSADTCHISYCHSPARYLWDLYHEYIAGGQTGGVAGPVFRAMAHYLRLWDVSAAARVDYFAANSRNVARRIRKVYRRDSTVVYPPVALPRAVGNASPGDYYLVVGRLVDYKRVDLAIEVCKRLGHPLHIVGDGPLLRRLRSLAKGGRIEFLPDLSDAQLAEQYAHCRALLFPGEDDFGITPVEAQAFGRPVIAYSRGGALETVIGPGARGAVDPDECTGIFFDHQCVDSLSQAVQRFEESEMLFEPRTLIANAERFSLPRFREGMKTLVRDCLQETEFAASGEDIPRTPARVRFARQI
jgi:glycosyltransferase involved in cell wall biosynthesis